jgi:hypothetical protein
MDKDRDKKEKSVTKKFHQGQLQKVHMEEGLPVRSVDVRRRGRNRGNS